MPELSVVIISFNEEKNIGRCLESVQEIADEIVVVDSFSTDRTEEICKTYQVRFIKHAFKGHIEQKNWAMEQAAHQHVLSLDADEALSDELKNNIARLKQNWESDGYYFNRLTNYCGKWIKHTGWYPDRKLRLWDKTKGHWGGKNPHDKFIMKKGSTQEYLKGDLLHYSFYSVTQHMDQINKFSSIAAKARFDAGRKTSLLNMFISPAWKFLKAFIFKAGFLDGFYGFVISVNSAHSTFLKHVKLRELRKNNPV